MGQKLERENNHENESLIDEMEVLSLIEENIEKQNQLENSICKDVKIEIKSDYYIEKLINIDSQNEKYVIQQIDNKINSFDKVLMVGPFLLVASSFLCCEFFSCGFVPYLKKWLKSSSEKFKHFIN